MPMADTVGAVVSIHFSGRVVIAAAPPPPHTRSAARRRCGGAAAAAKRSRQGGHGKAVTRWRGAAVGAWGMFARW